MVNHRQSNPRHKKPMRPSSVSSNPIAPDPEPAKSKTSHRSTTTILKLSPVPALLIGSVGCIVITASSVFTALRLGALPSPIVFTAFLSLFSLQIWKAFKQQAEQNEQIRHIVLAQTVMSGGAYVAGGLAFTIPGSWMQGLADELLWWQVLCLAAAGVALALLSSALLRKHFIDTPIGVPGTFPVGRAAFETMRVANKKTAGARLLLGSLGFASLWCILRDALKWIPGTLARISLTPAPTQAAASTPVSFGFSASPMLLAMGMFIGLRSAAYWLVGALVAHVGIEYLGQFLQLAPHETLSAIASNLGMGLMLGAGVAIITKDILPHAKNLLHGFHLHHQQSGAASTEKSHNAGNIHASNHTSTPYSTNTPRSTSSTHDSGSNAPDSTSSAPKKHSALLLSILACIFFVVVSWVLNLGPVIALLLLILGLLATILSIQSVGHIGINPLEVFGIIVMLVFSLIAHLIPALHLSAIQLFCIAAMVSVACGVTGNLFSNFKAGELSHLPSKQQWNAQLLAGILGACIGSAMLLVMLKAFGASSFGPGTPFIAAQASVVGSMVLGISHVPAFSIGLLAGFGLYYLKLPALMVGLGVYLPFHMSATIFVGALIATALQYVPRKRRVKHTNKPTDEPRDRHTDKREQNGDLEDKREQQNLSILVASGLLGGESIVGVVIALLSMTFGLLG